MNYKVSIIVPVYNAEKYLKRSIESILNQSYKNLEIIIIDDASTDKSVEIIKKYASSDNRIKVFYSSLNQGVSKSRNIGLKSYTGDYVLFMDADDFIDKKAVEIMLKAAIKYNSDYVDSYQLVIYKEEKNTHYFTEGKVPKNIVVMGNLKNNIKVLDKYTYIKGKLYKKELLKDLYFDESLRRYEDLVFEYELKLRVENMIFLNEVLYYYYQVPNSLTNSLGKKHIVYLDAAKAVIDKYKNESKEIKDKLEASLFRVAFFSTGIAKVVKNDDSISDNVNLFTDYIKRFDEVFPTWRENKEINKIVRDNVIKLMDNKKEVEKLLKKTKDINMIDLYFKYLSVMFKYK